MALFKSRQQRRAEQEIAVNNALANLRRQIAVQEKHERDYLRKAFRAREMGDRPMLEMLKAQIRRTHLMRRRFERNLLVLETAVQARDQIESSEAFGKAMSAVSRSIGQAYGIASLAQAQKDYEMAMVKAETMQERIELFLQSSMDSADTFEEDAEGGLSDEDLDRMLGGSVVRGDELDEEISANLKEIERARAKES